jgi:hypothetical protein
LNPSITLFDNFQRTEKRPAHENEPTFVYLNLSARPGFVAIRELLEEWFTYYPEESKKDLCSRFRKNDHQHGGAFFELFLHQYFRQLGYEMIPHPNIQGESTHPDFLARRDGRDCFYLEAIVPQSRQLRPGDASRRDQVHEALQRIESPNYFLFIDHFGYPASTPKLSFLIRDVEEWLYTLDYQHIQRLLKETENLDCLPVFRADAAGMILNIRPIPKSSRIQGQTGIRPVGVFGPGEAQMVDTVTGIRKAGQSKSKKYGRLRIPYIVAMNVVEMFVRKWSVVDALFGREAVRHIGYLDGSEKIETVREADGLWFNRHGSVNENISAVLVFLGLYPWNLTTVESILINNPFAPKPLTDSIPIMRIVADVLNGKLSEIAEELNIGSVLELPDPWPFPDDDEID